MFQINTSSPQSTKSNTLIHNTVTSESEGPLYLKYDSWAKLIRVTSKCLRFIHLLRLKLKNKLQQNSDSLSPGVIKSLENLTENDNDYIHRSRQFWLKKCQADLFSTEILKLKNKDELSQKTSLLKLRPFLDNHGVLRVGGRLDNSVLSYAEKYPIILGNHPITQLIIKHSHVRALHGGTQLTSRILLQEFWILKSRSLVRKQIHDCITCARFRKNNMTQLMSPLPSERVTPSKPFSHCGVDYAGPIEIRLHKGSKSPISKAYICLFICLTTRAVHIELVSNYSSEAFIAAMRRFISRRPYPNTMYSDNGTTFQGADKQLRVSFKRVVSDATVHDVFASYGIKWKYIPPNAPHFGGIWEAGIKSCKHHLRRIMGSKKLTFEELSTLLYQIEACMNSRPLIALNADPQDMTCITPGHFLIGDSPTALPESSKLNVSENYLNRWNYIQQKVEQFWKVWSSDYLNTLQERLKWSRLQSAPKVNDLVLLKDQNLPPTKWSLARIVDCHPGKDGKIRVVTVRTPKSTFTRPITKLCPLPQSTM